MLVVVAGTVAIVSSSNSRRIETRGHRDMVDMEKENGDEPQNRMVQTIRESIFVKIQMVHGNGKWRNKPPKWQPPMVSPIFNNLISEEEKIEQE